MRSCTCEAERHLGPPDNIFAFKVIAGHVGGFHTLAAGKSAAVGIGRHLSF